MKDSNGCGAGGASVQPALLLRYASVVEYLIGEGSELDPSAIRLATRRNSYIPNSRRRPRNPASMQAAVRSLTTDRRKLRSAASEYNCVGLVFASRRTWVDTDQLNKIFEEDEYRQIRVEDAQPGDVIVYRDRDKQMVHVGILQNREPDVARAAWNLTVVSQFGADGEYIHEIADVVPLLGTPTEAWTDRI